ncbi:hypothetical protein WEI85_43420 [Actinomycetes bacterium KLBMP 9797]
MSVAGVIRELLVRHLDTWTPGALHAARGATFAQCWSGPADPDTAEAALRALAEFADRMRGRRLTVLLVAPSTADAVRRLDAVQAELGTPAGLSVHAIDGDPDERLAVALKAAGAAGAPLLTYLDGAGSAAIQAAAAGKPAEVLLVGGTPVPSPFLLTARVEMVDDAGAQLVGFGTSLGKSLEAFKDALWAVDEYAGVRYRDPHDPEGHLLDISLQPHPGPLRRELLAKLAADGACTVTELRRFTLTDTVYRSADAVRAITALLQTGAVTRTPDRGRLSGDVLITPSP